MEIRETLHVTNLGPIRDSGLLEIRPLTVFIGASASGKSTLMKALVLMRYIFKKINVRMYLKNSGITKAPFYIRIGDLLRDNMATYLKDDTCIDYRVVINGSEFYVTYEHKKLTYSTNIPNQDLVFFKESWISEMRSVIPAWTSQGSFVSKNSLGFYFDETLNDFKLGVQDAKEVDLFYLGLKMLIVNSGSNQKKFVIKPADQSYDSFELKNASSGIQTTAPLMVIANYFSNSFSYKKAQERSIISYLFEKNLTTKYSPKIELSEMPLFIHMHIEEPELSLDPEAQRRMLDDLISVCYNNHVDNRQLGLAFATHSPYILNHLNVLLRRKEGARLWSEQISVYNIHQGKAQNLLMQDEDTHEFVVDTMDLSETMAEIFREYKHLGYATGAK